MRASTIMATAMVLYVIHRWSTGKTAVDVKTVVEGLFAVFVISMLDQGETEPVAKGFAWLFFTVALLNVLPNIGKAAKGPTTPPKPPILA